MLEKVADKKVLGKIMGENADKIVEKLQNQDIIKTNDLKAIGIDPAMVDPNKMMKIVSNNITDPEKMMSALKE